MERDKSWFTSFKNLRLGKRQRERSTSSDNVVLRHANETSTTCSRTRNSFRRSFIKFQTRVKNAMSRSRSNRHTIHNTNSPTRDTSSANLRVTLADTSRPPENIYTLDPVREKSDTSPDLSLASSTNGRPPELPLRNPERLQISPRSQEVARVPTDEISSLSNCYWYWGPLSRIEAEDKLKNCPDGAFLIRDSSSSSYLFSISFRSVGKTLHTRIEHTRGTYSLFDQEGYSTIRELIDHAMTISSEAIFCYSKSQDSKPNYPVRLTKPISRFTSVRPLKYLCRFVIKQCTNINDISKLPLPPLVIVYLQEDGPYF
ncbi:suppressor of cytokine signaling 6 [Aethina tumida]|uniref:suppressor of cytokine signaling 6 n=1 Tax=Aethina tumida TaxID=116153 RepID=UPI002148B32A|nr:suppressor of cytokine signaling 6 [Aethina tumida]